MKKLAVSVLVLILLLASIVPVNASRAKAVQRASAPTIYNGEILEVDDAARTVTMLVISGKGGDFELLVATDATTRFRLKVADGCTPITFDDLEVGQEIGITGRYVDGAFIAVRVTVQMDI